jgi:hypothetical protein
VRKLLTRIRDAMIARAEPIQEGEARSTTLEERERRALWGRLLCAAGQIITSAGTRLIDQARDDAEAWASAAHDTGYERHRADAAGVADAAGPAAPATRPYGDDRPNTTSATLGKAGPPRPGPFDPAAAERLAELAEPAESGDGG